MHVSLGPTRSGAVSITDYTAEVEEGSCKEPPAVTLFTIAEAAQGSRGQYTFDLDEENPAAWTVGSPPDQEPQRYTKAGEFTYFNEGAEPSELEFTARSSRTCDWRIYAHYNAPDGESGKEVIDNHGKPFHVEAPGNISQEFVLTPGGGVSYTQVGVEVSHPLD